MKKLMVLGLVVVLASMSSAAILLTIDSSTVAYGTTQSLGSLGIYSDTALGAYDVTLTVTEGVTLDTSAVTYPVAWTFASKIITQNGNHSRFGASVFLEAAQSGQYVNGIGISATKKGTITAYDNLTGQTLGCITVPEPITMGLLGLGGLFLRRRK